MLFLDSGMPKTHRCTQSHHICSWLFCKGSDIYRDSSTSYLIHGSIAIWKCSTINAQKEVLCLHMDTVQLYLRSWRSNPRSTLPAKRTRSGTSDNDMLTWKLCYEAEPSECCLSRRIFTYNSKDAISAAAVFVAKTGSSDRLPAAFMTSLHAAAVSRSYQEAIRQTLKASGSGMWGRAQLVCPHP